MNQLCPYGSVSQRKFNQSVCLTRSRTEKSWEKTGTQRARYPSWNGKRGEWEKINKNSLEFSLQKIPESVWLGVNIPDLIPFMQQLERNLHWWVRVDTRPIPFKPHAYGTQIFLDGKKLRQMHASARHTPIVSKKKKISKKSILTLKKCIDIKKYSEGLCW